MRRLLLIGAGLSLGAAAPEEAARRLDAAKRQSAAAQLRADTLAEAAAAERDAARKAAQEEAALAAQVEQARADIAAAQARIALLRDRLREQRQAIAERQGPIVRLIAALQSLAGRPTVVSLVQPGTVEDLVHVRAVLGSVAPVVRARTAALREQLARTRTLEAGEAVAVRALADSRARLETRRLALVELEAEHRLKSRALGRAALGESDRAIALGEAARDLVDQMSDDRRSAAAAASLAALGEPLPRPESKAEQLWPGGAPYRLPVAGQVVAGLGELADSGARARGITLQVAPGARVVAPAAGRVRFVGTFRSYGLVVILDHGGGWSTLIAGLGATGTQPGDRLAQGAALGTAPTAGTAQVTIELRRRDRPVDFTRLLG